MPKAVKPTQSEFRRRKRLAIWRKGGCYAVFVKRERLDKEYKSGGYENGKRDESRHEMA